MWTNVDLSAHRPPFLFLLGSDSDLGGEHGVRAALRVDTEATSQEAVTGVGLGRLSQEEERGGIHPTGDCVDTWKCQQVKGLRPRSRDGCLGETMWRGQWGSRHPWRREAQPPPAPLPTVFPEHTLLSARVLLLGARCCPPWGFLSPQCRTWAVLRKHSVWRGQGHHFLAYRMTLPALQHPDAGLEV